MKNKIDSEIDMVEWNIKETSDNCTHRILCYTFRGRDKFAIDECSHWDNPSKSCIKSMCPIKVKEKE